MSNHKRHNIVHETITATPPPPKTWKTPSYHLDRYTIRKYKRTVHVQLVGERGNEKRTESISFPLLPDVADTDLVRAAVWFSPHKWSVSFGKNISEFKGKFDYTPDQRLLNVLMQAPSASREREQPPIPAAYEAPTQADAFLPQQAFPQAYPQAGQFQSPPSYTQQPVSYQRTNKSSAWQWYKTRSRKMQVSLGCGTIIVLLLFFSIAVAAFSSGTTSVSPTPTPQQAAAFVAPATSTPTAPPRVTAIPTAKPKPTIPPTATPRPTPKPEPTQPPKPKPTPTPCNNPCNPWGYSFSLGSYIYSPSGAFCSYFTCINNFWNGRGYVVECQDGEYSKSGGIQGACSYHGGVLRPLYSH